MLRQSPDKFSVDVDGRLCFESPKIKLPLGYNFGITAASAENPDSFEVFKFVTTTESHTPDITDPSLLVSNSGMGSNQNQNQNQNAGGQTQTQAATGDIPAYSDPADAPASSYQSSGEQFADLHNRLQVMMKHINTLNRAHDMYAQQAEKRHEELAAQISRLEGSLERLAEMQKKVGELQSDVRQAKRDLHNALDKHVSGLRGEVRSTHSSKYPFLGPLLFFHFMWRRGKWFDRGNADK
jgi:mannose-binding lectin 1